MHAEPGLQPAGEAAVETRDDDAADNHHGNMDHRRKLQDIAQNRGRHGADHELPLGADIEEAGAEGKGDGHARQHHRH